ncbi:hypothetical protein GCM10012280_43210 [Wenjunlia tyrosinilytica]|uniref:Xaa-Pro dipeptidyl-peptidase C-terminal domain-containing protein n=1 Tax=Wenjunlia tyrosinilytica TaxID=1544741 RepID=A0A918E0A4_9ACTN|nr:hypothetical protein GCM10012280_43210 [Wenjunlia tyrosinilytica]
MKGNVFTPGDAGGGKRYPVVVLPASWALNDIEYVAQAKKLAADGYVVVSYTPRGFWFSEGRIDVAGPKDMADISKVIDWALAETPADRDRIGMVGVSYGAGLCVMGAAFDKRVKAVAAMSGWADLSGSIFSGRTPHLQASLLLGGTAYLTGRPSEEFQQVLGDFLSSRYDKEAELVAWGDKRSPATYLDRINDNGAAIMLANSWGDSLFPPNQLADFYDRLHGPKRLEFRPGDHVTPELTGLLGLPNDTWSNARRWVDHYLKGENNGIDREQPVQLKNRTGSDSGGYEGYSRWSAVTSQHRRLPLGDKDFFGTGDLGGSPDTGWRTRIGTNLDSGADGGLIFLSQIGDQVAKLPPIVSVPLLPRQVASVWQSATYDSVQRIRGTAKMHVTLTPSNAMGTVMAYLYDVNGLGVGKLVSHAPFTFTDKEPGQPFPLDLDLFSTAYDVPAGHRLALVVDTVDPLYIEHNPLLSSITFSSPADDPSWLSVPLRDD